MVICVTQVSAMVIKALYSLQGAPNIRFSDFMHYNFWS